MQAPPAGLRPFPLRWGSSAKQRDSWAASSRAKAFVIASYAAAVLWGAPAFAATQSCLDNCDAIPAACEKGCEQTAKGNVGMCKSKCDEAAKSCRKRCDKKKN